MKYILGYACKSDIFPLLNYNQTATLTYIQTLNKNDRIKYLKNKAHSNLLNLKLLLEKNLERNIFAFRITSNLIPQGDLQFYDIQKQHISELKEIGEFANKTNMYLSFHATEFVVLNSKTQKTVENSVKSINFTARILSMMNLKNPPNIVVHIGGFKQFLNWQEACDQWIKNFSLLDKQAQSFIVIENDQKSHSIDSCMYIHKKVEVPVVFDHAHYDYKPTNGISMQQAMKLAMGTWKNRTPKVHACSQAEGVKVHNHGKTMLFTDFLKLYEAIRASGVSKCIMMLQVKGKDESLQKLRQQIKQYENQHKIKL